MRRRSEQAKLKGKPPIGSLSGQLRHDQQAQQVLPILQEQEVNQAEKLAQTLDSFISSRQALIKPSGVCCNKKRCLLTKRL